MSLVRRAAAEILRVLASVAAPAAVANQVQIYGQDDAGVTRSYARTSDGTIYLLVPPIPSGGGLAWYGTGIDGPLVFDGAATVTGTGFAALSLVPVASVYTLTRDIFATDMTVDAGVRVVTAGYRVFVLNTLTLDGAISQNGGAGGNATAVAAGAAGAVASVSAVLYGGAAGSLGGAPTGAGVNGTVGTPGHLGSQTANTAAGGNGGVCAGGGGGANDAGTIGAIAPGITGISALNGTQHFVLYQAVNGRTINGVQMSTGSSGGGGRGASGAGAGGGGGSGASGGGVVVCARFIIGAGTIESQGGNGGNGNTDGGGGGGGAGGIASVVTSGAFPTVSVVGGVGGAAGGGGASTAGGSGGTGITYLFTVTGS